MSKPLIYHRIDYKPADSSVKLRDSNGGHPYLPKGMDYPICSCGKRMNFYLQFDIREEFGLPYQTGSHLAVFMCQACNNTLDSLSENTPRDETGDYHEQLRANYWEHTHWYRLMLFKPESEFEFLPAEEFIKPCWSLNFTKAEESWPGENGPFVDFGTARPEEEKIDFEAESELPGTSAKLYEAQYGTREFKVGGQPDWGGDSGPPNDLHCACGAPMGFICFIPDEFVFPNERTTVYSYEHVGDLLVGLCIYILACRAQCHPFAVYPIGNP